MSRSNWLLTGVILCLSSFYFISPNNSVSQEKKQPSPEEIYKMMQKAKKYTQPGKHHDHLKKFLGKWDTETRIFMGRKPSPGEKGTAETTWLMKGRWLQTKIKGKMMGQPIEMYSITGYDNFKMSYVVTTINSIDTAMVRHEGDMDPSGKALLTYGTLDEYLTGEHDKMVKTVWRFHSEDKITMEVHDLPIGEKNTKVFEIVYTRQKE